jgi:nucleotide-binding universal stress UspA family protein
MNTRRWLLPFTWGVDMQALDSVLGLAESSEATLVAVSLVAVPDKSRSRGARLEHIQQSKDFLEAVKWKAARLGVPVERYEVFTPDVMASIATLVHDLDCDSMILVSRGKRDVLLRAHELKRLLTEPPASFVLLRLPTPPERPPVFARFLSWLRRDLGQQTGQQGEVRTAQEEPAAEHSLAIRTPEPIREWSDSRNGKELR